MFIHQWYNCDRLFSSTDINDFYSGALELFDWLGHFSDTHKVEKEYSTYFECFGDDLSFSKNERDALKKIRGIAKLITVAAKEFRTNSDNPNVVYYAVDLGGYFAIRTSLAEQIHSIFARKKDDLSVFCFKSGSDILISVNGTIQKKKVRIESTQWFSAESEIDNLLPLECTELSDSSSVLFVRDMMDVICEMRDKETVDERDFYSITVPKNLGGEKDIIDIMISTTFMKEDEKQCVNVIEQGLEKDNQNSDIAKEIYKILDMD